MTTRARPSYRIRTARAGDAAEIARLTNTLGYEATAEETTPRLAALLPLSDHFVAVAEEGDCLLGWIAAEHRLLLHYAARAEVVGLVVGSETRRGGVGRALVAAAEQWAIGRGLQSIFVRSNVARAESHPFYESLGYRREKTQHAYVKKILA